MGRGSRGKVHAWRRPAAFVLPVAALLYLAVPCILPRGVLAMCPIGVHVLVRDLRSGAKPDTHIGGLMTPNVCLCCGFALDRRSRTSPDHLCGTSLLSAVVLMQGGPRVIPGSQIYPRPGYIRDPPRYTGLGYLRSVHLFFGRRWGGLL